MAPREGGSVPLLSGVHASPLLQNLDVNQALNNLLSREDDDPDDMHEDGGAMVGLNLPSGGVAFCRVKGDVIIYLPSLCSEELLSLLGSGLVGVGEEELEEALGRSRGGEGAESSGGRESRVALYEFSDPLVQIGVLFVCLLFFAFDFGTE